MRWQNQNLPPAVWGQRRHRQAEGPRGSGTAGPVPRAPAQLGTWERRARRAPEAPRSGPGKAARPRASPVQAKGATPLVE